MYELVLETRLSFGSSEACSTPRCGPLATNNSSFLFAQTTPNTSILVGVESELQAVLHTGARGAHLFGGINLVNGQASGPNREEQ